MPNEHLDMDAIEARANAAPPDPWTVHYSHDRRTYEVWLDAMCIATGCTAPEAEFIASARTDVPALCARIRELEAKLEPVRWAIRMACVSSCTCMTKTPDIVFHSAGCVYRRLVELERSL